MQDDEAAQQRCKPILHTNNVTWVASPENGRKVVLIIAKDASIVTSIVTCVVLELVSLTPYRKEGILSLGSWISVELIY